MTNKTNIVIIGTGNVAYHIAKSFKTVKEINIIQAFNHKMSTQSVSFARQFKCKLVSDYNEIFKGADFYVIAVKDDAIVEVAKKLSVLKLKGIVVHTSGSIEMNVLKNVSKNIGVYYPLETFYKGAHIKWKQTPLLIEGNSKVITSKVKSLANAISKKVKEVDSNKRLQIHLAAVFACNFTNAMYVSAYQIIENHVGKNDTDLLMPIMQHSFHKLQNVHPRYAQTGPAMRNDKLVMKKHLNLIKENKQVSKVYTTLSDLIMTQQNSK